MIRRSLFALIFAAFPACAFAAMPIGARVWVEVTVLEGPYGKGADEFYGSILARDFVPMTETTLLRGWLKLENVAWTEGRNIIPLSLATQGGIDCGYSSTMYLPKSLITCIIPLEDSFVKSRLLPALSRRKGEDTSLSGTPVKRAPLPRTTPLPSLAPMSLDLLQPPPKDSLLK